MVREILMVLVLGLTCAAASCAGFQTGPLSDEPFEGSGQIEDLPQGIDTNADLRVIVLATAAVEITKATDPTEDTPFIDEDAAVFGLDDTMAGEEAIEQLRVGFGLSGEHRILMRFDLGAVPNKAEIVSAQLVLTSNDLGVGDVEVELGPATAAWTQDVSWEDHPPLDNENLQTLSLDEGSAAEEIDLKDIVQQWRSGDRPNHGLLLRAVKQDFEAHKSFYNVKSGNGGSGPRLQISYRRPGS